MEANWETRTNVPLVLFAWPDEATRSNLYEVAIPDGASLILTHAADGVVPGLNDFVGEHPPVAPLFFGFRIMVGIGLLMLVVSWWGTLVLWRRKTPSTWLARALLAMTFSGWAATLAGWYVTEIGRQPWLVTGLLKTADAAGAVPAPMIAGTLVMYLVLYAVLLGAFVSVLFYLARKGAEPSGDPKEGAIQTTLGSTAEAAA
jgi:cytochrome d ubiquinol oxidase subunit I